MTRSLATFTSIILLISSTGCVMQRSCSSQDMIAMKKSGFAADRIESACTTRRFDVDAIKTLSESMNTGMKTLAELDKEKREAKAAKKAEVAQK